MFWTEIRSHHFEYPSQQMQLEVSYQTLKNVLHLDLLIGQQDYLWTTSEVAGMSWFLFVTAKAVLSTSLSV